MIHRYLLSVLLCSSALAEVRLETLPEDGMQPQIAVSASGMAHLIYLKGNPKGCEVRYTSRAVDAPTWAPPMTVNSVPKSAIAMGTIRGAQLSLGKMDSVQVIWNGSAAGAEDPASAPLWYARLEQGAGAFSRQGNLMEGVALDGGASIAANGNGSVCVVWHAAPKVAEGERARIVWVKRSADDGYTFAKARPLNAASPGVCACCSLRASLGDDGVLHVLYRGAPEMDERGMRWISQRDGKTTVKVLDQWKLAACPMSSCAIHGTAMAWENDGRICVSLGNSASVVSLATAGAKHPVIAKSRSGLTLVASVVGSGWAKSGTLRWDLLDASGRIVDSGTGPKLPVWSFPAAYARTDGGFVVLR